VAGLGRIYFAFFTSRGLNESRQTIQNPIKGSGARIDDCASTCVLIIRFPFAILAVTAITTDPPEQLCNRKK
jgi:hypothetical protein